MDILKRVALTGFKSIKTMDLELRALNVLIGANGAGKSNLVSFFKMLNEIGEQRLQQFVAASGRAHSLLFYGPKLTTVLDARLVYQTETGADVHEFTLCYGAGDTLFFADERLESTRAGSARDLGGRSLGHGHFETQIKPMGDTGDGAALTMRAHLDGCRVYHFHDTSATARIRQYGYLGDSHRLGSDGANLAAFLFRLQNQNEGLAYNRILSTVRLIAPFFQDFNFVPSGRDGQEIILNWRSSDSDQIFGPHQLSDGTLRAMCLVTLLLQPELELPKLMIVDEPELGLHPYALNIIASLFRKASHNAQVLISTQSSPFLDNFEPEDVIVVDRKGKESIFVRPDPAALELWLEEYSLGEVWEKNVIGGGPH
jgi:predicted ATPase